MAATPALATAGLQACTGTRPLLHAADGRELPPAMAEVAKEAKVPLVARAETPGCPGGIDGRPDGRRRGGHRARSGDQRLPSVFAYPHPPSPAGVAQELPAAGIPGHHLPRPGRDCRRDPPGGRTHRQVRRVHRPRVLRSGGALSAAGPAPEHLHRPAETDPGAAGRLRDQLAGRQRSRRWSPPTSRSPTSPSPTKSKAPVGRPGWS